MIDYSPPWALHVLGQYTKPEQDEDGNLQEQSVFAKCSICNVDMQRKCSSGAVRMHINRFAFVHLHRHPLGVK